MKMARLLRPHIADEVRAYERSGVILAAVDT